MPAKLVTRDLARRLPALYAQKKTADPIVHGKFFTPDAQCTWLLLEYDGKDTFFAWCDLGIPDCAELGYVSLAELQTIRGRFGLPVERDRFFTPAPLSQHISRGR